MPEPENPVLQNATPIDKDPWCCAVDKLRINMDGFDAGYINALQSARRIIKALSQEQALQVLDELIADYTPQRKRQARP